LNDISKSEEHFGADSFEVGYALTGICSYAAPPAEPATSSMDIALRLLAPPGGAKPARRKVEIIEHHSHVLVTCYSDSISARLYNAGRRKEVVQAADIRSCNRNWELRDKQTLLDEAEALFHRRKSRQVA
jgi:hypothetical protein